MKDKKKPNEKYFFNFTKESIYMKNIVYILIDKIKPNCILKSKNVLCASLPSKGEKKPEKFPNPKPTTGLPFITSKLFLKRANLPPVDTEPSSAAYQTLNIIPFMLKIKDIIITKWTKIKIPILV